MQCPKCSFEQPDSNVECPKCGIIIARFKQTQARRAEMAAAKAAPPPPPPPEPEPMEEVAEAVPYEEEPASGGDPFAARARAGATPPPPPPPRSTARPATGGPTPPPASGNGLRDIGALFNDAWQIFARRWATLVILLILILPLGLVTVGSGGLFGLLISIPFSDFRGPLVFLGMGLGLVAMVVGSIWIFASFMAAVIHENLGVKAALNEGQKWLLGMLWLGLLVGLIIGGGFILFFVPGIIFSVWFFFSSFALIEGGQRGMSALARSRELVRSYFWPVLGRIVLLMIVQSAAQGIPILGFAAVPFIYIAYFLIYQDLKAAHDNKAPAAIAPVSDGRMQWVAVGALGFLVMFATIAVGVGMAVKSLGGQFGTMLDALKSGDLNVAMSQMGGTADSQSDYNYNYEPSQPATQPAPAPMRATPPPNDPYTRPSDYDQLIGTWTGGLKERGENDWTLTFSPDYSIEASGPGGMWYKGTVAIFFNLGAERDGTIRVPPGWGLADVLVKESSEPSHINKRSLGTFSMDYSPGRDTQNYTAPRDILKFCGSEPGKHVRATEFESTGEIQCLVLNRQGGMDLQPAAPAPAPAQPAATSDWDPWPNSPDDVSIFIYSVNYKGMLKANGEDFQELEGEKDMQYSLNKGGWDLKVGTNRFELEYNALPGENSMQKIEIEIEQNDRMVYQKVIDDQGGRLTFDVNLTKD